ncbi:hypothetical protein PISMIDRAFT_19820 [Pisolithus microcarpus 441]|uniref:Uncharacterized protein n=1 Tax=Pisolithus microcarpus 441 TaxID=765257 RepID=A0A0C9Y1M1_9AGAM|nr:hypothetical protein PISMIDRAFT_19820 [Pisolithus microcarpus 441]
MNGLEDQAANILEAAGLTEADIDDAPSFSQTSIGPLYLERKASGTEALPTDIWILTAKFPMLILWVGVLSSALDDWAKEEESHDVIDPEGGWELDANAAETEEQEDEFEDAVGDEDVLAGELHPV